MIRKTSPLSLLKEGELITIGERAASEDHTARVSTQLLDPLRAESRRGTMAKEVLRCTLLIKLSLLTENPQLTGGEALDRLERDPPYRARERARSLRSRCW